MTTNEAPKPQVRAACYCRISSDPDDKREGVDRQRADTAALCEVKGWRIAGFYVDNDKSATNGKARPEWDRLLADIAAGRIDAVAAWDQDRVNRTLDDLISYKQLFVARGIKLATSNSGDVDLSTPAGELMATIKTAVSTHEVAMMKVRMKRAGRAFAESGAPKWHRAFGYRPGVGGPELDPVTAPLVADAYAAVIAGASLGDVTRMLNAAGAYGERWVRPKDDDGNTITAAKPELQRTPWTASTVSLFLRKPRNAGLRAYGGDIVAAGKWPALVSEATWRTAQDILNAPHRKPGRKSVQRHLLTGAIYCGKCGHHLTAHRTASRQKTYSCMKCRGVAVLAENIEPYVFALVAERLSRPDAVDLLKGEVDPAEAEGIRRDLGVLYARLETIGVAVGEGDLTPSQAKAATDTVNAKIAALEARQQDTERVRVFAGLPLGAAEVADAVGRLPDGRLRAVLDLLAVITIAPVGKGRKPFSPDRVRVEWRT
jgi:DNA invertase Pin-like site-specific DNA recombinase